MTGPAPGGWRYRMAPGHAPSAAMLDAVGLDFDGDLGGLKKHPVPPPPRLHPAWVWLALCVPPLLVIADAAFGLGFIAGLAGGVAAMLVAEASRTRHRA